jgi:hypothetical protein
MASQCIIDSLYICKYIYVCRYEWCNILKDLKESNIDVCTYVHVAIKLSRTCRCYSLTLFLFSFLILLPRCSAALFILLYLPLLRCHHFLTNLVYSGLPSRSRFKDHLSAIQNLLSYALKQIRRVYPYLDSTSIYDYYLRLTQHF